MVYVRWLAGAHFIFGLIYAVGSLTISPENADFVPFHWQTRWFILDGWLNLVYLGDVIFVAYIWRPTANNRRFAMSDELAQDDEGFEIADFGAEDDEDDDIENAAAHKGDRNQTGQEGPRYDPAPGNKAKAPSGANTARDIPRDSLDGETIFAVGEDGDRWSDDESDEEERGKLVGKKAKD
ncbi:hypothetical protein M7I_4671 [Glarea lozoyensis 74030]|uniref:GOST seven transmembrane domain-containing protein n=1 Tax=Glarea lozoyensis (strain ATCC 74030 / MF5533) TaxID=1104152 RepID=H0EPT4_GLAL7|nr:hypothetical protein M7I_4671 [Glarea lozoyensis 74030]